MYCGFGRQPGPDGDQTMREHAHVVRAIRGRNAVKAAAWLCAGAVLVAGARPRQALGLPPAVRAKCASLAPDTADCPTSTLCYGYQTTNPFETANTTTALPAGHTGGPGPCRGRPGRPIVGVC